MADDLPQAWAAVISALSTDARVSAAQRASLRLTRPIGLLDGTALVAVPDAYTREVLEQRVRGPVVEALILRLGAPVSLAVTVDAALAADPGESGHDDGSDDDGDGAHRSGDGAPSGRSRDDGEQDGPSRGAAAVRTAGEGPAPPRTAPCSPTPAP